MIDEQFESCMRIQHVLTTKYGIKDETDKRWRNSYKSYLPIIEIDSFDNEVLKEKLMASKFLVRTSKPSIGIIVQTADENVFVPSKQEMLKMLNCM